MSRNQVQTIGIEERDFAQEYFEQVVSETEPGIAVRKLTALLMSASNECVQLREKLKNKEKRKLVITEEDD